MKRSHQPLAAEPALAEQPAPMRAATREAQQRITDRIVAEAGLFASYGDDTLAPLAGEQGTARKARPARHGLQALTSPR